MSSQASGARSIEPIVSPAGQTIKATAIITSNAGTQTRPPGIRLSAGALWTRQAMKARISPPVSAM